MKRLRTIVLALVVGMPTLTGLAQMPPHPPGSICRTPQFWCWINPPGPVGQVCTCPTPYGPVRGVYS